MNTERVEQLSGKCEDCNQEYVQYQATSHKNTDGYFQTKRFYRCPRCSTIYVEVDAPDDGKPPYGIIRVEKYPPVKEKLVTLDDWR